MRTANHVLPMVVGYGRSGSTLLVTMLDSHPDLAIPAESGGLLLELCRRSDGGETGRFDACGFVDALCGHARFRQWGLSRHDVTQALSAACADDAPSACRAVYGAYARSQGKRLYGDKTPRYVLEMDAVLGFFPEARFLHVIRDGRNVALSTMDASWGPDSAGGVAAEWRAWTEAGMARGKALGPERYHEVRYEDLVVDPAEALRATCAFLGIDFDPAMLDRDRAARRQVRMSIDPDADRSLLRPLDPSARDWRRSMDERDVVAFESVAGDLLDQLGYQRA